MKRIIFFLATSLVVFLAGCELTLPVELPESPPKLVVNGLFDEGTPWRVEISHNKHILDKSSGYDTIPDASVEIFESGILLTKLQFVDSVQAYIGYNSLPQPGKEYKLKVSAPGYEPVEAINTLPDSIEISNVELLRKVREDPYEGLKSDLKVTFKDPAGVNNFYQLELILVTQFGEFPQGICFSSSDPLLSGSGSTAGEVFFACGATGFKDETIQGQEYELTVTMSEYELEYAMGLKVIISNVSKEYFLYQESLELQNITQGNPFAEPVIVFNNIKNGFGIFAGKNDVSRIINL